MPLRRTLLALPPVLALLALTACAAPSPSASPAATHSDEGAGHGAIAGAREVGEPPLALLTIDDAGAARVLDLLSGEESDPVTVPPPSRATSDGRYGFLDSAAGLTIVDSGRWTWDHGDHFHYYLAESRVVGTVPGEGPVTTSTGMLSTAGSTGLFFAGTREAVLVDNASLSRGELTETFRIALDQDSAIVAPLGTGAAITVGDALVFHDATGAATARTVACADASGVITTRVGVVVGCADGAVLATWADGAATFERIPYPDAADAGRALDFDGRKGRPTVAGRTGGTGFWLLDSRALAWRFVPTGSALARIAAVDDADGHVVALDSDGRVRVYRDDDADATHESAVTDPLVDEVTAAVTLTVDDQRAYLNDPATGRVFEIDYADGARVARTLTPAGGAGFVVEVGR